MQLVIISEAPKHEYIAPRVLRLEHISSSVGLYFMFICCVNTTKQRPPLCNRISGQPAGGQFLLCRHQAMCSKEHSA